jgi:bacterioferritin-associated ferredoxin
MFVCLCKGVTERHIREAIGEGEVSFDRLQQRLGVSSQCGTCEEETRAILMEYAAHAQAAPDGLFYAAV